MVGDPSMWELYRYDHKTLLSLQVLSVLAKKEAAQSLYIYFEAMPAGTLFVSMKRLRERLLLTLLYELKTRSSEGDAGVKINRIS